MQGFILTANTAAKKLTLLANLSRRLIGELIVYLGHITKMAATPISGLIFLSGTNVRTSTHAPASVVVVVVHHFQTYSPPKPLDQSKPNFMWSLLGKGEQKFI